MLATTHRLIWLMKLISLGKRSLAPAQNKCETGNLLQEKKPRYFPPSIFPLHSCSPLTDTMELSTGIALLPRPCLLFQSYTKTFPALTSICR